MPMSPDPSYLRHMRIPFHQLTIIFQFLALAVGFDAAAGRSVGAPKTDVAVVGAGEDIFVVGGEDGGKDALHAFGVVDVFGVAFIAVPEADTAVIGGGDEFLARGAEFDVHDGGDVVFENVEGAFEVSHVEDVDVVIFGGGGEVEGFHGVPGDFVGGECECSAAQGGGSTEVV